ncbi:MAG TPA: hypothetical protein VGH33_26740, partial [Isosphaeraceae bacterium]
MEDAVNAALADSVKKREKAIAAGSDPVLWVEAIEAARRAETALAGSDASLVVLGLTAYLRGVEGRLRDAELATARAEARAAGERRRRQLTLALA